ncbi:hypothetical protein [Acinetobacter baumannii]|uniref:hypothetical protein n=1 Tax=Acinetobacter baumannii TaxID=470 RepID=UPI0012FDA856|nr:hypothetical protein [Acinetobacter baumannii]
MGEVGNGVDRLTYVRRGVLGYINKNVARSLGSFVCFPAFLDRGGNIARHWHGYSYDKSWCSKEVGNIQRGMVCLNLIT